MPHKIIKKLQGLSSERKLTLDTKLIDNEKRMIPFILISRDNAGERYDWWKDEVYIEKLDVDGANYERLKTFFKDHIRSVDSAIARVDNIRVEDSELKADIYFGTDDVSDQVFRKYQDGILTDCSISYKINTVTVEERKDEPDIVTITDFDIRELSAVGIGFDPGATVGRNQKITLGDNSMNEKLRQELAELKKSVETLNDNDKKRMKELSDLEESEKSRSNSAVAANAIATERTRTTEISALVMGDQISQERASSFIQDGTSIEMVRKSILDEKMNTSSGVEHSRSEDSSDVKRGIEDAILVRCGVSLSNLSESASNFRGASLLDMARALTGYQGYDNQELAKRAMSTNDFPLLLGNVANRVLAAAFEEEEGTFSLWTQSVELPDFRQRNEVKLSSQGGRLQKVKEKSEKKKIEFDENGVGWALESYGATFILTREMIINDDLDVFTGIVAEFGKMAKRTSNGLVYDLLQNTGDFKNYKMSDGKAIFDSSHDNVSKSGTALASEALSAARVGMRRQKDNGKSLNISPSFLIVAPEEERTALQLLTSESDVGSTNSGVTNPHKNTLTPIVENELNPKTWYLAAKTNTIKVGYLQGSNRQPIVEQKNSDIDGAEFKCVFDFGVVVTDHRGLYKNAGE